METSSFANFKYGKALFSPNLRRKRERKMRARGWS
jgi:hypothetical protein